MPLINSENAKFRNVTTGIHLLGLTNSGRFRGGPRGPHPPPPTPIFWFFYRIFLTKNFSFSGIVQSPQGCSGASVRSDVVLSPKIFPLSECSGSTPNKQGHRVKISDILCQNQLSSMSLNLRSTCFGSKRAHCHSVQNLKPDSKVLTWFHHTLSVDIVFLVFGEARIHSWLYITLELQLLPPAPLQTAQSLSDLVSQAFPSNLCFHEWHPDILDKCYLRHSCND